MTLDVKAISQQIASHAQTTRLFDAVLLHEPKSAPSTSGLTFAVWLSSLSPHVPQSSLGKTALRLVFTGRIFLNMLTKPEDDIDNRISTAAVQLFTNLTGDYTLNGTVKNMDLLGQSGTPLQGVAGYLTLDNAVFRVFDFTIPVLPSDEWSQTA